MQRQRVHHSFKPIAGMSCALDSAEVASSLLLLMLELDVGVANMARMAWSTEVLRVGFGMAAGFATIQ